MIACSLCQTVLPESSQICRECGPNLAPINNPKTEYLDKSGLKWIGDPVEDSGCGSVLLAGQGPWAVRLTIEASNRKVVVPFFEICPTRLTRKAFRETGVAKGRPRLKYTQVVHIGRTDPGHDFVPDIDLSHDSPLACGVSRRHARILKQGDSVVLQDLGSANGTFLNGKKLEPFLPVTLNDGDAFQVGALLIEVALVRLSEALEHLISGQSLRV